MVEKILCSCGKYICKNSIARHKKSAMHSKLLNKSAENKNEDEDDDMYFDAEEKEENKNEDDENEDDENEDDDEDDFNNLNFEDSADFLTELHNDKFVNEDNNEKEDTEKKELKQIKMQKEKLKLENDIKKLNESPKKSKKEIINDNIEILGKNKRVLIAKITCYKNEFKEELKNLKIPKNPTEESLQRIIDECDTILNMSNIDKFILDGIFVALRIGENLTRTYLKLYDLTGLSEMLKNDPKFNKLCKILMIRYGCFSAIPEEYQLLFCILTTSWVCINKNRNRDKINEYLNEPIN
jgi:hypothetical protein